MEMPEFGLMAGSLMTSQMANFCINGLNSPDGSPHPALQEVAWAYRPIEVVKLSEEKLLIKIAQCLHA